MNKNIILSTLFVLTSLLFISVSQAATVQPTLSFNPSTSNVNINDVFSVDVVISGLENGGDEIVSAFDLDVGFDASILQANSVTFGLSLGDPVFFEAFTDSDLSNPGFVNLAELSLLPDPVLQALQGDSIVLASIEFTALAGGASNLSFISGLFGYDVKGLNAALLDINVEDGLVNVATPSTVVPVPAALPLMVSGLAFLGFQGRRRKQ